jgi:hypothetical protein
VKKLTAEGTQQLDPEAFDWLACQYHEFSDLEKSLMDPHLAACGQIADAMYDRDIDWYNSKVVDSA